MCVCVCVCVCVPWPTVVDQQRLVHTTLQESCDHYHDIASSGRICQLMDSLLNPYSTLYIKPLWPCNMPTCTCTHSPLLTGCLGTDCYMMQDLPNMHTMLQYMHHWIYMYMYKMYTSIHLCTHLCPRSEPWWLFHLFRQSWLQSSLRWWPLYRVWTRFEWIEREGWSCPHPSHQQAPLKGQKDFNKII